MSIINEEERMNQEIDLPFNHSIAEREEFKSCKLEYLKDVMMATWFEDIEHLGIKFDY
jgi:hypothetical protein